MSSPNLQHPDEADLMRLLDGELAGRSAREIRSHIESCWQCRRDLNEMQSAIDAFLRFREASILPQIPPPPQSWPDLRGRCEDLDLALAPRRLPVWRMAIAAGLIGMAALAGVIFWRPAAPVVEMKPAPVEVQKKSAPPAAIVPHARGRLPEASAGPTEIQVLAALHGIGADLGEAVEVIAGQDGILVRATALDPARAAVIKEAVRGARFETIEPKAVAAEGEDGPAVLPRPVVFGAGNDFANVVIDEADAIMARAHGLGQLSARFSGAKLADGDALTLRRIEDDHRQALRRLAVQLQKLLAPLQVPEAPGELKLSMADAAREMDELVSAGFGGAPSTRTDAEIVSRLLRVLRELER